MEFNQNEVEQWLEKAQEAAKRTFQNEVAVQKSNVDSGWSAAVVAMMFAKGIRRAQATMQLSPRALFEMCVDNEGFLEEIITGKPCSSTATATYDITTGRTAQCTEGHHEDRWSQLRRFADHLSETLSVRTIMAQKTLAPGLFWAMTNGVNFADDDYHPDLVWMVAHTTTAASELSKVVSSLVQPHYMIPAKLMTGENETLTLGGTPLRCGYVVKAGSPEARNAELHKVYSRNKGNKGPYTGMKSTEVLVSFKDPHKFLFTREANITLLEYIHKVDVPSHDTVRLEAQAEAMVQKRRENHRGDGLHADQLDVTRAKKLGDIDSNDIHTIMESRNAETRLIAKQAAEAAAKKNIELPSQTPRNFGEAGPRKMTSQDIVKRFL